MKQKIFLDNNVFDFFINRRKKLQDELPSDEYTLAVTYEIFKESQHENTPEEKRRLVQELEESGCIKIDRLFGMNSYEDPEPEGITGFSDYNGEDPQEGTWLSYDDILEDGKGDYQLLNSANERDKLLAARSVKSVVLTCDNKRALRQARRQGHKIVYLGKVNPDEDPKEGFDLFCGNLKEYVQKTLVEQSMLKLKNVTLSKKIG